MLSRGLQLPGRPHHAITAKSNLAAGMMSRDRYEKEIEEILKQAGEGPSQPPQPQEQEQPRHRRQRRRVERSPVAFRGRVNYRAALVAGVSLIVVAAILNWMYFLLAGILLVGFGYYLYYRSAGSTSSGNRTPRMWRGRSIEPDEPPGRFGRR